MQRRHIEALAQLKGWTRPADVQAFVDGFHKMPSGHPSGRAARVALESAADARGLDRRGFVMGALARVGGVPRHAAAGIHPAAMRGPWRAGWEYRTGGTG